MKWMKIFFIPIKNISQFTKSFLLSGWCGAVFVCAGGGYGLGEDWALVDLDFGIGISAALTVPAKCYDRIELRRLELK
jgi:hypothetical protein